MPMRRFASFASTLVLAVTFALPSAAETSRWDWLRARVFGAPPVETNAKAAEDALARRGGTRMILQIDSGRLRPAVIETMRDDTRRALREAGIPWAGRPNVRDGSVEMRLREADVDRAKDALGVFFGRSTIDLHDMGGGVITLAPTTADFGARLRGAREQAIDVIRLRVKELGIAPADVRADDNDRIVVLLPGVTEPARLALLTARAELTFRLVDVSMTPADALRSRPPLESEVLYDKSKEPLLVHKQVLMGGKELLEATAIIDHRTQEPVIAFRFTTAGAKEFGRITQENVGRPFAIVLDQDVIMAPVIREPILGGSGQISGGFSVEQANDLAILLRSGALPAGLVVVEQRTVEPQK